MRLLQPVLPAQVHSAVWLREYARTSGCFRSDSQVAGLFDDGYGTSMCRRPPPPAPPPALPPSPPPPASLVGVELVQELDETDNVTVAASAALDMGGGAAALLAHRYCEERACMRVGHVRNRSAACVPAGSGGGDLLVVSEDPLKSGSDPPLSVWAGRVLHGERVGEPGKVTENTSKLVRPLFSSARTCRNMCEWRFQYDDYFPHDCTHWTYLATRRDTLDAAADDPSGLVHACLLHDESGASGLSCGAYEADGEGCGADARVRV